MQLGKVFGIESHVLSPGETKELYPLMNVDDLYGTLYVPEDGTMDPAGTCMCLARAASNRGALVGSFSYLKDLNGHREREEIKPLA